MERNRIAQYKGYWSETDLLTVLNFVFWLGLQFTVPCEKEWSERQR